MANNHDYMLFFTEQVQLQQEFLQQRRLVPHHIQCFHLWVLCTEHLVLKFPTSCRVLKVQSRLWRMLKLLIRLQQQKKVSLTKDFLGRGLPLPKLIFLIGFHHEKPHILLVYFAVTCDDGAIHCDAYWFSIYSIFAHRTRSSPYRGQKLWPIRMQDGSSG